VSTTIEETIGNTLAALRIGLQSPARPILHFGVHGDFELPLGPQSLSQADVGRMANHWQQLFPEIAHVQIKQKHACFHLDSTHFRNCVFAWDSSTSFTYPPGFDCAPLNFKPTENPSLLGWQAGMRGEDMQARKGLILDEAWLTAGMVAARHRELVVEDAELFTGKLALLCAWERTDAGLEGRKPAKIIASSSQVFNLLSTFDKLEGILRQTYLQGNGGEYQLDAPERELANVVLRLPMVMEYACQIGHCRPVFELMLEWVAAFRRLWVLKPICFPAGVDGTSSRMMVLAKSLEAFELIFQWAGVSGRTAQL
jgi:hypothetical protein